MSIEPEVPYNLDDEGSSDEENNNWRDLSINNPNTGAVTARLPLVDIDFGPSSTPLSQQAANSPRPPRAFADTTVTSGSGHRNADDHWVLPAHINLRDVLGSRNKARINTIQQHTGSFIEYNETYNQVDIWGDADAIAKTKRYLEDIVQNLFERDERSQRKTKKWGKPERELTERERRRAERKQAKIDEEKRYQGLPAVTQNYHAVFPLPDSSIPLLRFSGENESYFNQIRADCKTYLWYEEQGNLIRLAGDSDEAVKEAAIRIRNWYLKSARKPMGGILRLMEQPTTQSLLEYKSLPKGFVTFKYTDPEEERVLLERNSMLQSVNTGVPNRVDLIGFADEHPAEPLSDVVKTLNARNENLIEQQLAAGLESLRLNNWVIRMKIRFGQICLVQYPKMKTPFLSVEYVSDRLFRKTGFVSELAPCISKSFQGLGGLFEFLSTDPDAVEFSDNPRTSFAISAQQYPDAAPPRVPGQRDSPRGEMWDTILQISFTEGGQRRLWSTMTDCVDLVDISMTNIESNYSWDLKLQYARRLPSDDVNSPHEKFSRGLRISGNNRLVLATSNDYLPKLVIQKTKWQYSYKGFIIEVCQDEIWDMDRVERTDFELPVDLSLIDPHRSLYKVSLYKESWVDRFAENLDLKIGQAPSWSLRDFLASPDENTRLVMQMAKHLAQILNSTVPLYWDNAKNSLV
ncbi:hypothetical protein [Parasitella parasitica]|uniref:DUF7905 domain-containing protein n=1 Tax=Parasitella parasitica TaxID=35722 RepID=A0A0B7NE41_9FUNG|nr:hypothetical protein [Parasitella parasitica]